MKKIGFIDYHIDEWHANNYPKWIRESSRKNEKRVRADKLGIKRSFACQPGQKIIIQKKPGLTS
ncbi:MAG: hypothetical protein L3J71_05240 [Victivallaceae bacterium]|nr:hypothetical protein [Victivallaceae bacterium]